MDTLPDAKAARDRLNSAILDMSHGFVVIFRMCCLGIVEKRFGKEVMQRAVSSVSNFLTSRMHRGTTLYQWKSYCLIAIYEGYAKEQELSEDLQETIRQNRDITVEQFGKSVVIKVPLLYEIKPIDDLREYKDISSLG